MNQYTLCAPFSRRAHLLLMNWSFPGLITDGLDSGADSALTGVQLVPDFSQLESFGVGINSDVPLPWLGWACEKGSPNHRNNCRFGGKQFRMELCSPLPTEKRHKRQLK